MAKHVRLGLLGIHFVLMLLLAMLDHHYDEAVTRERQLATSSFKYGNDNCN